MVEIAVAFVGGTLSLLSPCSALLLPSFFAYSFASPGRLLGRTLVFYAGLLTLFVPLGLGVGALGATVREHLGAVTAIAGSLLILVGLYQFAVGGFGVPGASAVARRAGGESVTATYVLGLVYGVGGFCSGPILAGILTLATASGHPASGAVLLSVFALGMVVPLLVLASVWDRLGKRRAGAIRTRTLHIGRIERHWSTVASSLIFVVLGAAFIVFRGANALSSVYERAGASDLVFRLENTVEAHGGAIAVGLGAALAVMIAVWGRSRLRRERTSVASPAHVAERTGVAEKRDMRRSKGRYLSEDRAEQVRGGSLAVTITRLETTSFTSDVLHSDLPVVVDFYADWCGPCHQLAPIVDVLSAEWEGRVRFAKVNVDDDPTLAGAYGVRSIPTLVLFEEGRPTMRSVGAKPASAIERDLGLHRFAGEQR